MLLHPLIIMAIGIMAILTLIIFFRVNAFVALIGAAIIVSLLAPLPGGVKAVEVFSFRITRVATAFGETVGKIGIVIAMAAVIGQCLVDSGGADRVVRFFVGLLGIKRAPISLMTSGFILSIPVFFDTVFYLLLPLARSMHRRTGRNYLFLILSMGIGASITHSLVPPTPGPLIAAETMKVDIGSMIGIGLLVSVPTAFIMYPLVRMIADWFPIPMRPLAGSRPEPEPLADDQLPPLWLSLLPIALPVVLITMNTAVASLVETGRAGGAFLRIAPVLVLLGDKNLTMLLSASIAVYLLWRQRHPSRQEMAEIIDGSLMSAGMIILITSAGGAFGAMLKDARIGDAIQTLFAGSGQLGGVKLLMMAFFVAFLIKFAQGSSTVAMLTTSAMMAALLAGNPSIGYHPAYLVAAIGFGAQCGNWMNDSGFWVFAKMGGLTEVEGLKTWTVCVSTEAVVGLAITAVLATVLPFT